MTRQEPLTIVAPVEPKQLESLFATLKTLNFGVEHHLPETFEKLGTIHFARWLVIDYLPAAVDGFDANAPKLVFSSNFDGDVRKHIVDLCEQTSELIDSLYGHCVGYPNSVNRTASDRIKYLTSYMIRPSAFYRGSPGRSLTQIRQEDQLHTTLRNYLNAGSFDGLPAQKVLSQLQVYIRNQPGFEWALEETSMPKINWFAMAGIGLILLLLLPVIIFWVLLVQFGYERHDTFFTMKRSQLNEAKIKDLEEYEDIEIQNQFSQLVRMKPGWVRLTTYKAFMLLARGLIRFQFVEGKLMGIPTIHFARWVLFDNNKRVLFFSNFDGSWQQYLGDFIDQSGWGLSGIFSNTTNFPKTRFLVTGGAYDEEHFLAWSRNSEIKTHLWYSAYPHLSIKNVNNNTRIRVGLFKQLNEKQATSFLKLI